MGKLWGGVEVEDLVRKRSNEPPLTEPVIVPCTFITGIAVAGDEMTIRITGWSEIPAGHGEVVERRVSVRMAMSSAAARILHDAIGEILERRTPWEHEQ